ncbi:DsbE family thiol:disulfide interchange protein [Gammaproteobacteria bacterium]|nr:DsbE family thiol:disulfide interchange protein [Gammaproteobacteria bacterium]
MAGRAVRFYIPLVLFVIMGTFLAVGLKLDPRQVPSPLIDKPVPEFSLPRLDDPERNFNPADLKGTVWVLNVWASWCVSCRAEHDVLKDMVSRNPVPVVGLNYKDKVLDAQTWLQRLGDPYYVSVVDAQGQVGIDWGVYGVPETFVIDNKGIIRYKHIGPIDFDVVKKTILPIVEELQQSKS